MKLVADKATGYLSFTTTIIFLLTLNFPLLKCSKLLTNFALLKHIYKLRSYQYLINFMKSISIADHFVGSYCTSQYVTQRQFSM